MSMKTQWECNGCDQYETSEPREMPKGWAEVSIGEQVDKAYSTKVVHLCPPCLRRFWGAIELVTK